MRLISEHLLREFIYLAVIIDVFSRKCIGWKLGRDIDAKLALAALDMALSNRKSTDISNLIHHSDQESPVRFFGICCQT